MTIILDGGDGDDGVGIRMVQELVQMILMMFCVGGDDSGIGVIASHSTIFDGVGDTFLSQVVETNWREWWRVGAGIGGELAGSLTIRLMVVAIMVLVTVILVVIGTQG